MQERAGQWIGGDRLMFQQMKLAALFIALTVGMGGLARAWDDDDDYYRHGNGSETRQYGYQNGYRDGIKQGRHEGKENDPGDFRVPDDGQASRGYRDWMGPIWVYQNAYRDGYRAGFRAGYNNESRTWGDGDADDFPVVYGGNYGGLWSGNRGYRIGFRDGASVAREDMREGKPYNPNPRGRYDDEDHGYSSMYGSKSAYKAQYASGYRAGYDSTRGRY
jgi:hypothetical protein